MLYSVIIKKHKHMSTFKVEETIVKTIKRVYFVDTDTDEKAVHIVMRNKKDVDEEIEGKEIVTGYEVKRARFRKLK
jgi:hypothetical protein